MPRSVLSGGEGAVYGGGHHARVFEGVNANRTCPDTVSTFENYCLAGERPFGDLFQDSGVAMENLKIF